MAGFIVPVMKLDLPAINKLNPPGLHALEDLQAFVLLLARVIGLGIAGASFAAASVLVRYNKELSKKNRANLDVKIKTWVLSCPGRIADVRSMIGEAAIKAWAKRMRAAYFAPPLRKTIAAGQETKIPVGKSGLHYDTNSEPAELAKPFALARLADVEKLLPFRPRWPRHVGAHSSHKGSTAKNPRQARQVSRHHPVRFFPSELGVSALSSKTDGQKAAKNQANDPPDKFSQTTKSPKTDNRHQSQQTLKKPP